MQAVAEVQNVVDTIVEATRHGTEAALRAGGALMRPQMHLLAEDEQPPYLGYLSCRPFYRGNDVVEAIGTMGVAASLADASRLVVVWEHQDLCVALQRRGVEDEPSGLVALDANRDGGHVLRWQPFRMHLGPTTSVGLPTIIPEWGQEARHPDVQLPSPVAALLAVWREPRAWTDRDRDDALAYLEGSGYQIRWVRRSDGE